MVLDIPAIKPSAPRIVLVTGMSGAGKSVTLKTLEDMGYEAIDNLPLSMVPKVVGSCDDQHMLIAVGIDIRNRDFSIGQFQETIHQLRALQDWDVQILFLDADNDILHRRFSETRRKHPIVSDRPVMEGIAYERGMVRDLRAFADIVLDTSEFTVNDLRRWVRESFTADKRSGITIVVRSFSFRHGIPRDADMLFDVRFLQNPYYIEELKDHTGREAAVQDYVMQDPVFSEFFQKLTEMLLLLLPRYQQEGKSYLTIAVGCTGGRHRSVCVAEKLFTFLKEYGCEVSINHRDLVEVGK